MAGKLLTRLVKITGDRLLRGADGGARTLRIDNDRFALIREIVDETAHAQLIVGVGALQRCNLVMHQKLKLAGTRQSTLNAIAHGRDLATDRLADGDDGTGRRVLRL